MACSHVTHVPVYYKLSTYSVSDWVAQEKQHLCPLFSFWLAQKKQQPPSPWVAQTVCQYPHCNCWQQQVLEKQEDAQMDAIGGQLGGLVGSWVGSEQAGRWVNQHTWGGGYNNRYKITTPKSNNYNCNKKSKLWHISYMHVISLS